MNIQQNPYCRLIHYGCCNLTPRKPFKKQSISLGTPYDYLAFREDYEDIESIQSRLAELNKEWKQGDIYPADRVLVALAEIEQVVIITSNREIMSFYSQVIW